MPGNNIVRIQLPRYTPRQRELLNEWAHLSLQGKYPYQGMLTPGATMTWEEGIWLSEEVARIIDRVMSDLRNPVR